MSEQTSSSSSPEPAVQVTGPEVDGQEAILTPEALDFFAALHREFGGRRDELLAARHTRRDAVSKTGRLDFLEETQAVRDGDWRVAPAPADLLDRRVEMTGPTDRKMTINALNSGARVCDSGPQCVLPDRATIGMPTPFIRAYAELLVKTCHRRGAFAIGGMSAFIPSRRDQEANERAFAKVTEDKEREAGQGFDGSWVAHPDLVPICEKVFDGVLHDRPNQFDVLRDDVHVTAADLLDIASAAGQITRAGLEGNVEVAARYLESWLGGNGAVGIHNLMEDAATAEISRSQIWQWVHNGSQLGDGTTITDALVREVIEDEHTKIRAELGDRYDQSNFETAFRVLEQVALADDYVEFLTLPAYDAATA